ncbi:hypothetical protein PBF_04708 [Cytobacillus firmus DS1]|uniref:Uncharacterized protein n=1 Tax=Cytobacillus firmus DS1 TaxID=1307436 RepID=W7LA01_CYTFI|nr:hypothetical protein PBF_04708 [Cytobacillus firmus DS1]
MGDRLLVPWRVSVNITNRIGKSANRDVFLQIDRLNLQIEWPFLQIGRGILQIEPSSSADAAALIENNTFK